MERFDIDLRFLRGLGFVLKDTRHAVKKLILSLLDLVWMNIELRRQLAYRPVALQSR